MCAHAGRCTEGLHTTFREDQEPFVDPDTDTVERIIETIRRCPSGALSYSVEAVDGPQDGHAATILVTPGPYAVAGRIAIDQAMNSGATLDRYTLCRCGGSKNKPFCDGTHWEIEFKDDRN